LTRKTKATAKSYSYLKAA